MRVPCTKQFELSCLDCAYFAYFHFTLTVIYFTLVNTFVLFMHQQMDVDERKPLSQLNS